MPIKDKKLDAFFWVGGLPTPAVTDLGATPGLKLKLIDHNEAFAPMVKKLRAALCDRYHTREDISRARKRRTRS
jgi:TRAP-type uncharacterized transport system substrate-binding protein